MSPETLPLAVEATDLKSSNPETDPSFPDAQLKPAPLRISRRSRLSTDDARPGHRQGTSPSGTSSDAVFTHDGSASPTLHSPQRTKQLSGPGPASPPPRHPVPSLIPIVSKYEVLNAVSHIQSHSFESSSPRRYPRTPSIQSPGSLEREALFKHGTPFHHKKASSLMNISIPEWKTVDYHSSEPVSPTRVTFQDLRGRLRRVAARETTAMRESVEGSRNNTTRVTVKEVSEDAKSPPIKANHECFLSRRWESEQPTMPKRLSKSKTDDITGWVPHVVAERRKIFEQGKFTEPTVTRTTVPSASTSVGHQTAADMQQTSQTPLKLNSPHVTQPVSNVTSPNAIAHKAPQQWSSVADLRAEFEKGHGAQPRARASTRLPLPVKSATQGNIEAVPERRHMVLRTSATETMLGSDMASDTTSNDTPKGLRKLREVRSAASSQPVLRDQTPATKLARASRDLQEEKLTERSVHVENAARPVQRSRIPVGNRRLSHGSNSSAPAPKVQQPAPPSRRARSKTQSSEVPETATSDTRSPAEPRPSFGNHVLRPRILSVKITTTNPGAVVEAKDTTTDSSQQTTVGSEPRRRSKVQALRSVFDRPHEPAVFKPFIEKSRRDTTKSLPSLPITVSTTVAVSTQRSSAQKSSSSGTSEAVHGKSAQRPSNVSSEASSQGATPKTPSQSGRNKLKKKMKSPVKERIDQFESIAHTSGSAGPQVSARRPRLSDPGHSSKGDRKKASGWEFRGSRMFRALSAGSSKDESIDIPDTEIVTAKSSLEAAKRLGGAGQVHRRRHSKLSGSKSSAVGQGSSSFETRGGSYTVPTQPVDPQADQATKVAPPHIDGAYQTASTDAAGDPSALIHPTRKSYSIFDHNPEGVHPCEQSPDIHFSCYQSQTAGSDADISGTDSGSSTIGNPIPHSQTDPKLTASSKHHHHSRDPSTLTQDESAIPGPSNSPISPAFPTIEAPTRGEPTRDLSINQSWGRRAAAAAFALGRRLKERRVSGARSVSLSLQGQGQAQGQGKSQGQGLDGTPGGLPGVGMRSRIPRSVSRDAEHQQRWDVFVAKPNGGLQHPRPARVLGLARRFERFEEEVIDTREGKRAAGQA